MVPLGNSVGCAIGCLVAGVAFSRALLAPAPEAERKPALVTIETTLATAKAQIRQFAFDGDANTYFASEKAPAKSDHFTFVFDQPVRAKSIALITGRTDESDLLQKGTLEVSSDSTTFRELAKFVDGKIEVASGGAAVKAIRIRFGEGFAHPVAIRELTIESLPKVAAFKYPVEFRVNVADEPKMKDWAESVAKSCTREYSSICELLMSDRFKPPHVVSLVLRSNYRGVAFASGTRITGSVKYFQDHPDDVGAMIHETVHVVQDYRGRENPGWLVEGVADYIRFFKFEPGKIGRINPDRAHFNGSYRVTAAFLAYVTDKYDKQLIQKLNKAMREGQYKAGVFQELTGKSLEDLDKEWISAMRGKS